MARNDGVKIVLTASETEISDFRNNPFIAFSGSFPYGAQERSSFPLRL